MTYAFTHAALLNGLFCLVSLHHDLSFGSGASPLSLWHRGETLRIVKEELEREPGRLSDGIVGAVTALAAFDVSSISSSNLIYAK
jgi:hypothetical protein